MSETTDTPAIITPEELVASLPEAFERGLKSGHLLFFDSTTTTHKEAGIDFEIRQCPALLKKPNLPAPTFDATKPKSDPFAPPYLKGLLIGEIHGEDDTEYIVMLNKYSVVKHHFLLITKDFQSQNAPPTPPDLTLAYQIILASQRSPHPVFAFFNCGDRSGASQPHKHLQFIPSPMGPPIERVARGKTLQAPSKPFSLDLPFAHYIRRLPPNLQYAPVDEIFDELGKAFMTLLDLGILAIRHDPHQEHHPPGPPSYNILLTTQHLYLIPRTKEKHTLTSTGDSTPINALGFAGMILVKSEEEGRAVVEDTVITLLSDVGVPKMEDEFTEPQNEDGI